MPSYFFPHHEALAAALWLVDDPVAWSCPVERLELGGGEAPAWLLRSEAPLATLTPIREREAAGAVVMDGTSWPIASRCEAPRLMEAVPLAPAPPPSLAVVYVLADSPRRFREYAQDCLMLDNDRLRYLPLGGGQVLLRIEQLSAFLLRRWQTASNPACYTPAAGEPRLLQPWGWRFPLPGKLALVETGDELLCLLSTTPPWTIVRGRAEDIYERIAIDAGRLDTVAVAADADLPSIPVSLRLEPAERTEPPRLWWLTADQEPLLHRLVAEAGEDELHGLQLARIADGGFVVVARPGSQLSPAAALLHAPAWTERLPDEHLYVPVGQRLAPLLSRRSLIEALDLQDSLLTIILRRDDGGLLVRQLQRHLLRPLADLADYRIARAKEPVAALLAEVAFDFDLTAETPDDEPDAPAARPSLWESFRRWLKGGA